MKKQKSEILDMFKLDDIHKYFEKLLRDQTNEIIDVIHEVGSVRSSEIMQELEEKLSKAQDKNSSLESKVKELENTREHYKKLFDDKKLECKSIIKQKTEVEKKIISMSKEMEKLESELREVSNQILREKNEKEFALSKRDEYEKKYKKIDDAYFIYQSLPESVKQRMSNIFGNGNVYSFIVAVSDWNNIEGIWGFIKRRIIENEEEGLAELVKLFLVAFELFCMIDESSKYELIRPIVGEYFDSDKQSIKGIKTDGQIEKVLLDGVYDLTTKKAVFKAVVQVQ